MTGAGLEIFDSKDLHAGDRVYVEYGAFKGLTGELVELKGKWRFVVRLDCLGKVDRVGDPRSVFKGGVGPCLR